MNSFNYPILPF